MIFPPWFGEWDDFTKPLVLTTCFFWSRDELSHVIPIRQSGSQPCLWMWLGFKKTKEGYTLWLCQNSY